MFSNYPSDLTDFIAPNFFCSDCPGSFFRVARLANIYTDNGFRSLENGSFKLVSGGETTLETVETKERELEILREYFGIVLG
ncbi:MAG: arylamine N-acetyltransferase [Oscillospiraceae bacterium]|nr:arylamine N-acetyltransferase [Oscillospiraceae bacterium]